MIDNQLHLIDPTRFPFPEDSAGYIPGPSESGPLEQLLQVMAEHGIDQGVLVQASVYGVDNAAILEAARADPDRFRAVVMANAASLPKLAALPYVAGLRLNMTDYAAHSDRGELRQLGADALDRNLVLQLQGTPSQSARLISDLPSGPIVLDHLGRPDLTDMADLARLARLAERPSTYLKLSAPFRVWGRDWDEVPTQVVDLVRAFGDRLLWGSDWPFLAVPPPKLDYANSLDWFSDLADPEVMNRNASKLFWRADV